MENRRLRSVNLVIHRDLAVCAEVWIDLVQRFDENGQNRFFITRGSYRDGDEVAQGRSTCA